MYQQKIEELKKLNQQIDKTPGFAVKGLAVKAQALQVELLEEMAARIGQLEKGVSRE